MNKTNKNLEILPPNQEKVDELIRLDLGYIPDIYLKDFIFEVKGNVKKELFLTYDEFISLGLDEIEDGFHCVTGWSKLDCKWEGVLASKITELAKPNKDVKYVLISSYDGYTTNVGIKDFNLKNSIFAVKYNNEVLKKENGFPVRLIIPSKYAYKSAKWTRRVTFLTNEELGYWEKRGYSNSADPFKEERYG